MTKEELDRKEIKRILDAPDLFQVLSIHTECTDENIIIVAYESIAPKVFPLTNKQPQAMEAFKRVTDALLTLCNEQSRVKYLEKLENPDEIEQHDEEEEEEEVDPYQIFYKHFPDAKPSSSIWRIIKQIFSIFLILYVTFHITPIAIAKILCIHPLNIENVQSGISFDSIPNSVPHTTDKGVHVYLPYKWSNKMFEYYLIRQNQFLKDVNTIVNQIWENQLEEKCEMEKNLLKGKAGTKCKEYYDFINL